MWRSLISSPSNKNVLIVADNEAAQNVRADVSRSHGVEVHCAKDSVEAALLWVPDFFNLVLLDVRHKPKDAFGGRFDGRIRSSGYSFWWALPFTFQLPALMKLWAARRAR